MIPKEHGEELEKRRNRRYSNHYADLWSIVLVIALLIFCKINFNTFNPFTSGWAYIRISQNKITDFDVSKNTTMIKTNFRKNQIELIKGELYKSGFNLDEEQTHKLVFSKDGLTRTYTIDEKSLFGVDYALVIMEENQ